MRSVQNNNDKYLFDIKDYKVIRCINRGGFGVINLVEKKDSSIYFAAKTNLIETKAQNKLFISREVRILIQIQHPTIIQFRGFSYIDFDGNKNVTILMDYMKEGSLSDLIDKETKSLCPSDYNNTKRQIILIGIPRGMMILHSRHVIHRDLKPENILLDNNYHPHITDFGLSKFFDPHHSMNQSMSNSGTSPYMAPEVINSDHFNTKADVYAFGILMYEILTGKRAYDDLFTGKKKLNDFQLKMKVTEGLRPNIEPNSIKKPLQILIEKCWSENPKERPSFIEIFRKLSLSCDDYFLEFDDNNFEPSVIDDNDEMEEFFDEEFSINKKYCLDDVDYEEVLNYVYEINEEPKSLNEQGKEKEGPNKEIEKFKEKISSLEIELKNAKSDNSNLEIQMNKMDSTIKKQSDKILRLETELKKRQKAGNSQFSPHFFNTELSMSNPGILFQLKNQEKTSFDRYYIASQSSNDPYNLLDPSTKDMFGIAGESDFYIEFVLEKEINITGFKVYSSTKGFPRSFSIEVEGRVIHGIKNAHELNGKDKEMKLMNKNLIRGKIIKFVRTGPSWDQGPYFYTIRRFEILSNESEFSNGVFSTFVKKSPNNDCHKCPVLINSKFFDSNHFHLINNNYHISTLDAKNSWFQIELTKGFAIVSGCRLYKCDVDLIKSFKIVYKKDDKWLTLIEINENNINEHCILDVYHFEQASYPTNMIRICQTGPNWNNNNYLVFYHFDIFGTYI